MTTKPSIKKLADGTLFAANFVVPSSQQFLIVQALDDIFSNVKFLDS